MNCVVCQKPLVKCERPNNLCFTCSPSCAGKLAASVREVNKAKKLYKAPAKERVREILYNKYIKPHILCEKSESSCFNILDFWGGGLFSDYIIDHLNFVKNQSSDVNLYEIDQNKDFFPALRKYAYQKNQLGVVQNQLRTVYRHIRGQAIVVNEDDQSNSVNNQKSSVIPFCGSLAKFVQFSYVNNQRQFDFIWLDYCKTIKQLENDLKLLKPFIKQETVIALSLFAKNCHRQGQILETNTALVQNIFDRVFGYYDMDIEPIVYKNMVVYVLKDKYKITKEVDYYEAKKADNVPNYARARLFR